MASLQGSPPPDVRRHVHAWWTEFPYPSNKPLWLRRLSHKRGAEYFGMFMGERAAWTEKSKVGGS